MAKAWVGAVLGAAVLAGCGGGGGSGGRDETLYVSMNYPGQAISLFEMAAVVPAIDGLQGRAPSCALVGGVLPAGLHLRGDCSIVGRAMAPGIHVINIRLSATGVSNTVDFPLTVQVNAPQVWYPDLYPTQNVPIGTTVSYDPQVQFWVAGSDVTATWSYTVHSGTLPAGLTLNPATGRVSGTTQTSGVSNVNLQATLNTPYGSYLVPYFAMFSLNVNVPALNYSSGGSSPEAYVSQAVSITPTLTGGPLPGAVVTGAVVTPALPPGLSADDAGVITGTPTEEMPFSRSFNVQGTLTHGGASGPTQGTLSLFVRSPVRYYHPPISATLNTAFSRSPTLYQNSPVPLAPGATTVFVPDPVFCRLPTGTSVNPATGTVSGTPTERGYFPCPMNVDITNNGVTWTMPVDIFLNVY